MTKLLTTGQMIDQLKPGEIAELDKRHIKRVENICYDSVKRDRYGNIRWYKIDKNKISSDCLEINDIAINYKWRILPNYVSFDKAMQALKEGKTVAYLDDFGNKNPIKKETALVGAIKPLVVDFEYLFKTNWVILDD